jgi:C1A family cysteine protease
LATVAAANLHDRTFYEGKFYEWMTEHKVQIKNGADFVHMLQNFANNDDLIETTNAQNLSYTLGHNAYSHMSNEEFNAYFRLGLSQGEREKGDFVHHAPAESAAPASIDWVTLGAVTPVKNQGNCGSCWSFSAVGALEGAYKIRNNKLNSYSEQHFVSCDTLDSGCNGGLMDRAFTWAKNNGGVCSESAYPYTSGTTGSNGSCSPNCTKDAGIAPKSYTDVQTNSDQALVDALAKQPVSVAIQANQPAFQMYKSGVLTGTCGTRLDHGVLAVGYGTWSDGTAYYKVKNSWGTSWGMDGYILIERNSSQKGGQCGILSGPPSYPNL